MPYLPTLGCELGVPRKQPQRADNPFQLYKAMNNTSRHIGDYEFVNKNPIYNTLVAVSAYVHVTPAAGIYTYVAELSYLMIM